MPTRSSWLAPGRRLRALVVLVGVAVLSFGALALIGRFAEYGEIERALAAASPGWLPVCLAGLCAVFAGYALSYRGYARLRGGPRMSPAGAARVSLAAIGAGAIAASVGTLAVGFWAIRREGVSVQGTTRRLLALSTYQWLILGWAAVLAGCLVLSLGWGEAPLGMIVFWLVVVPAASIVGFVASGPRRAARADGWSQERAAARGRSGLSKAAAIARGLYAEAIGGLVLMREAIGAPRRNLAAVLGFPVYWAGHLTIMWAALRSVGAEIPLPALVIAFATGYIASGVPLPGGAGSVDAGLSFALAGVGVPLAEAVVATLVFRFVTLWLPIVPALVVAPSLRGRRPAPESAGRASAGEYADV